MTSVEIMSLVGVLVGLVVAMLLTYKGWAPILVAPLAAAVMLLFSGMNPLTNLISSYVPGAAKQFQTMYLLYVACFIFARVMTVTKSCYSIGHLLNNIFGPERATTALLLFAIVLRLGGLNVGVYLVIYYMGLYMFKQANYSEDMLLAICIAGTWTFCNSMPFFPSNHNIIAMGALDTTSSAGLSMGMAHGIIEAVLIILTFEIVAKRWRKKGRVFTADKYLLSAEEMDPATFPPVWKAAIPLVVFVVLFNVFGYNVAICMFLSAFVCMLLNMKKMSVKEWFKMMEFSSKDCLVSLACTCAMGGLGTTITATPFYGKIFELITTSTINPYILTFAVAGLLAFILASASSACATIFPAFLPLFQQWTGMGYDMGVFHRIVVSSTVAFNTMPHNGVMSGMIEMYHTDYKKSLPITLFTATLIPIVITTAVVLPMAVMGFK